MSADSYYEVTLWRARINPAKVALLVVFQFLLLLLPIPTENDIEAKRRCQVEVRRKSDGSVVTRFAYRKESDALARLAELREQLTRSSQTAFEHELRLDTGRV